MPKAPPPWIPLLVLIGGCTVASPKVDPAHLANVAVNPSETRTEVLGDWDDLTAALGVGLGKLSLTVVDSNADDRSVRLELVDVLDKPAVLRVERLNPGPPASIRITAAFTGIRDEAREKLLVAAVAQRFAELRGVDIAPVR